MKDKKQKDIWKTIGNNIFLWALIIIMTIASLRMFQSDNNTFKNLSYSSYFDFVKSGNIEKATITGNEFKGTFREPQLIEDVKNLNKNTEYKTFTTVLPEVNQDMLELWNSNNIHIEFIKQTPGIVDYIFQFSPWILIILFWIFIMRKMQGPGSQNGIFNFGRSRAKIISSDKSKVTFKDVAGCDEAKVELKEIVDFLKDPKKYIKLGAKIPRGGLLLGPPGTGKTLLAKAVSGEAKVPFLIISGAEFVEMFVGVGASRVRDLFDQAKRNSPSIIFIDEIDAVGRHRGAGLGGGHDEREQTLNQILVEMDGFETNDNVIMLAATNRPDVLDKALLRPGRFDRQIVVDAPSVEGREQILKIHSKKVPLSKSVNLKVIAKGTPGLVGADLENLVNEAAILCARRNKKSVTMNDFEEAKDKVMMGVERKSMILTDFDKKITAYHEAGHALVAYHTKGADPVHKITIIPRGQALGITAQLPENDKFNYQKKYLLGRLDILMGGRSSEKLIFNDVSTGAGNDISVATDIARKMVCEWGMSSLGPLAFGKKEGEVFLGKEMSSTKNYSEHIGDLIDKEIVNIIRDAEKNADTILKKYIDQLHLIAKNLLDYETITGNDMIKLLSTESS